jgi:hypothetical protein
MVLGAKIVFVAGSSVFLTAAAGLLVERWASATVDQLVGSKIGEIAFQTNIQVLNTAGAARAGNDAGFGGPHEASCKGWPLANVYNPDRKRRLWRL